MKSQLTSLLLSDIVIVVIDVDDQSSVSKENGEMLNNSFKLSLATLLAVAALNVSIANAEALFTVDLADKPHDLLVPIGQQAVLLVTNSASEAQTLVLPTLSQKVVVEPGQTVRLRLDRQDLVTGRYLSYRVWEQDMAAAAAREEMLSNAAQAATVVTTGSPTISKYEAPVFEEKAELPSAKKGNTVRGYW